MLRYHTGGRSVVEVEVGENVRQCLFFLQERFPGVRKQLFDGQWDLWTDICVFKNKRSTYPAQEVEDGDEIVVFLPMAGG
jgi:molybdopterin converting factor small subunit